MRYSPSDKLSIYLEIPSPDNYSFILEFSPLGSMATRDIVARSIDINLKKLYSKADEIGYSIDLTNEAKDFIIEKVREVIIRLNS